MEEKAAVAWC